MGKTSVSYDIGTNFDPEIIKIIRENDKEHKVKTLYGKIKYDGLPGGRSTYIVPDFTLDQFQDYLKECKANNLSFNYLINPLCMDNIESDPEKGPALHKFIHDLYDMGIREFTINSPTLIKYIKKSFSDASVTLGLYAYPTNISHIEYWKDWGVDEITLDHSFNRNFPLLKHVLKCYKDSSVALRVIANNLCMKDCPFKLAHGCSASHTKSGPIAMDYYLINCAYRKLLNPKSFLTSEWIRPEDIHIYEELAEETGFRKLSVKLVDRTRSTAFLERVIKAYLNKSYNGNLLDILNWPEHKNMAFREKMNANGKNEKSHIKFEEIIKPDVLRDYSKTMEFPDIYIDNKKLDGFLDHFIAAGSRCTDCLCSDNILPGQDKSAAECRFCASWFEKAVTVNKNEIDRWSKSAARVLDVLEDCSLYSGVSQ